MNRVPALLPLLALAVAACSTKSVPLFGFDTQPDGSLLLQGSAGFHLEAVMELDTPRTFRFRFNGMPGVIYPVGQPGPLDYLKTDVQEWVGGTVGDAPVPPGTYVVEMVDTSGTSWGQTPPIAVSEPLDAGSAVAVTIIFVHLDGRATTWVLDPSTQDSDPATIETTVSNLSPDDVPVKQCQLTGDGGAPTCTSLGTVAPGADLQTVETIATDTSPTGAPVLGIGPYQLPFRSPTLCPLERIVVTGTRPLRNGNSTPFDFSSCDGF